MAPEAGQGRVPEKAVRGSATWISSDWARSAWVACLVFLLCFNSSRAFHPDNVIWRGDDGCYLQHLGVYLGIGGEDICKGSYLDNFYAPGAAVLWMGPGLIGKAIALALGARSQDWVLPLAALGSYACWALALYFMMRILGLHRRQLGLRDAWLPGWALLALLTTGSLHYATVRVFMAHAPEIMLALGCVWFLLRNEVFYALPFAMLLVATRYNDAPVALLLLAGMLDRRGGWTSLPPKVRACALVATAGILGFGTWIAFFQGYDRYTLFDLWDDFRWEFVATFLFSSQWGMLWSGAWWLGALGIGLWRFRQLSYLGKASVVWLALEAMLAIAWNGNGNDFGYRYLIGSYAGGLVVWLEWLRGHPVRRRIFLGMTLANGAWIALATIHYATSVGNMAYWDDVHQVAQIPPNLMLRLLGSVFDWESYRYVFYNRIVPVTWVVSLRTDWVPSGVLFRPLVGPERFVAGAAAGACAAYLATYLTAWAGSKPKFIKQLKLLNKKVSNR